MLKGTKKKGAHFEGGAQVEDNGRVECRVTEEDAAPYPRQKATITWHKPTCKSIQSSAVLPLTRETAGIWKNEKCDYILSNRAPGHTRHRASKARK